MFKLNNFSIIIHTFNVFYPVIHFINFFEHCNFYAQLNIVWKSVLYEFIIIIIVQSNCTLLGDETLQAGYFHG